MKSSCVDRRKESMRSVMTSTLVVLVIWKSRSSVCEGGEGRGRTAGWGGEGQDGRVRRGGAGREGEEDRSHNI